VAALIKKETGLDSELLVGGRGELSVWVGGTKVAERSPRGFPADAALLTAVKQAIAGSSAR
jgi:hypothetical protein